MERQFEPGSHGAWLSEGHFLPALPVPSAIIIMMLQALHSAHELVTSHGANIQHIQLSLERKGPRPSFLRNRRR